MTGVFLPPIPPLTPLHTHNLTMFFLRPIHGWFCFTVALRRSGDECIVALTDQWYLPYGEEEWAGKVKEHVNSENFKAYSQVGGSCVRVGLRGRGRLACFEDGTTTKISCPGSASVVQIKLLKGLPAVGKDVGL